MFFQVYERAYYYPGFKFQFIKCIAYFCFFSKRNVIPVNQYQNIYV